MPDPSSTQVFAQVEQEAYHACIEWPIWLVLRQRQLEATIQHIRPTTTTDGTDAPQEAKDGLTTE